MKSYEEMTDAVLRRAGVEKAAQKRRQKKITVAAVCMCVAALVVFAGARSALPTEEKESRDPRVSVFCVTASAADQRQEMVKSERLPYNAVIRVHDIAGLGELELQELREADKEYAEQIAGQNTDDYGNLDWSIASPGSDKVMVTTIFVGSYYLTVDDYSQIQEVTSTTTEIGWTAQHLTDYYDPSMRDGVGITWGLSDVGFDMIEKDPDMALSKIKDTITVTVEFKDGSKDVVTIDITVDDDGQIYGTFQGVDVIA